MLARTTDNGTVNKAYLLSLTEKQKRLILGHISVYYLITEREVWDEVTGDEAEKLLDYMTGSLRTEVHGHMLRKGGV
jgi:hypothetical protein